MTTLVIDINAYIMLKKITKSEPVYAYKYHAYIKTKNKKNMYFFFLDSISPIQHHCWNDGIILQNFA